MAHTESCFTFYDRRSRQLVKEPIYASPFFRWSYTTVPGGLATELLFRHRCVTRLCGWYYKQPWSRRRIHAFVLRYNVNMEESARRVEEFTSFNDFFTREIDLATRPIHPDPRVCIAPNDGRILGYPVVDATTTFGIKRHTFNLSRFLRDDRLAKQYVGGSMVISRFYLQDYHYFHFPDSGTPGPALPIQGKHYALGPYWGRTPVPWFSENYRMFTLFDSDHFGQIAMMEIGAFTVGSIQQRFNPGVRVPKGARKGFFELGGSTVVLLFQRGAIRLDEDLCARTEENIETFVRFGESIGKA